MSRWIDADAYERELRTSNIIHHYGEQIVDKIHSAPTIEIIRCRECKWGKPYSDKQLKCNALGLGGLKFPNDFCSYGEREASE